MKSKPKLVPDLDTEGRILDAARRVFIRRGTAGARMQEIAEEAGVNQALLHYYFRTKAALADRVFLETAGRLVQTLTPLASRSTSLEELIERFVQGYIDAVRQTPFIPGYLLAEMHHHPERLPGMIARATGSVPSEIAAGALTRLESLIATKVAAGEMRPIAPHHLLINVLALVVFPFAARPVLSGALGLDEPGFQRLLDERRSELPRFILNALRP